MSGSLTCQISPLLGTDTVFANLPETAGTVPARIAVVGAGIAGLAAAWLLSRRHAVTIFEAERRLGGHSNTVTVAEGADSIPVDTGFIVYNERNYPHLCALFEHLRVPTLDTSMSFAASIDGGRVEYAGTSLATMFAQPANLLRPRFHGMLRDILRFNTAARRLLREADGGGGPALGHFLAEHGFGAAFRDWYLLPMAAAIWSCSARSMLAFPVRSLASFFDNHGLLDLDDRPQWRTVAGGSREYVRRLATNIGAAVHLGSRVAQVERRAGDVRVRDSEGHEACFDHVVMATHADQALSLLHAPGAGERAILGAFDYQPNRVLLHSDRSLMPRRRRVWSSWNYLGNSGDTSLAVSVSYWMNRLQSLACERDYFVSLNPLQEPAPADVHGEFAYSHPVFDGGAMRAQGAIASIQGRQRTWFCGSYCGYGFHEDALRSAMTVADALGVQAPWLQHPVTRELLPDAHATVPGAIEEAVA